MVESKVPSADVVRTFSITIYSYMRTAKNKRTISQRNKGFRIATSSGKNHSRPQAGAVSPQPRFTIPIIRNLSVSVPVVDLLIASFHLIICVSSLMSGTWIAIKGVEAVTLQVAETHRTRKIITKGVYSIVKHPQYLGGLLGHVGISSLLSAGYSLLSIPLMSLLIYLISKKEEEELIREFGEEYKDY